MEESKSNYLSPRSLIPGRRQARRQTLTSQLTPLLALLRQWQSERLAKTHQDLLASRMYGPPCRFFLSDVYAPRDFSQRDEDILHVYQAMKRIMPAPIMHALNQVIMLNDVTTFLDHRLLQVMVQELHLEDAISPVMYAEAYRLCDNYEDRVRQIDLIVEVGRSVNRLLHLPFVGLSLRLAHTPARLSGWVELQSFLERGFKAFKHMKGVDPFLNTIEQREKQILDQIYAGDANPFELNGRVS